MIIKFIFQYKIQFAVLQEHRGIVLILTHTFTWPNMPPLTSTRPGSILALNWFHSVLFKPKWRLFLSSHPGVDPWSQRFTEYDWACWFLPVLAVRKASGIRPAGRSPSPSCIWEGCWCAECSRSRPSFSGSFCTTQRRRIKGIIVALFKIADKLNKRCSWTLCLVLLSSRTTDDAVRNSSWPGLCVKVSLVPNFFSSANDINRQKSFNQLSNRLMDEYKYS